MTRHDPWLRVQHMLDHALEAVAMCEGRSRGDLDEDRQFSLALVRLMEIIGEAASRVPESLREQYPQVAWRDAADLRNRLIHGYDEVDLHLLWKIIADDLPPLIEQLQPLLDERNAR